MRPGLKNLILDFLEGKEWTPKVLLFNHTMSWEYSPETIGRELRKLAQEGKLKVSYYNGKYSKNLAQYRKK